MKLHWQNLVKRVREKVEVKKPLIIISARIFLFLLKNIISSTMTTPIESLWRQALKTFTGRNSVGYNLCQKNFEKLRNLMNEITAEDVKVDKKTMDYVENQSAPMCAIDIFENKDIVITVFLLKQGVTLPMHDHPGMHGLLKVISGTVKIDNYTTQFPLGNNIQYNKEIIATKHPSIIVGKSDPACVLTPHDHNFHEISCLVGPAAFLDILSPPYDICTSDIEKSLRPCTFFRQIRQEHSAVSEGTSPTKVKLLVMEQPPLFYSASIKYKGPTLR